MKRIKAFLNKTIAQPKIAGGYRSLKVWHVGAVIAVMAIANTINHFIG